MKENPYSFFIEPVDFLDTSDWYKVFIWAGSKDNTDDWIIDVKDKWVNGTCEGVDTGKFYKFLCENGLGEKIDIIRG